MTGKQGNAPEDRVVGSLMMTVVDEGLTEEAVAMITEMTIVEAGMITEMIIAEAAMTTEIEAAMIIVMNLEAAIGTEEGSENVAEAEEDGLQELVEEAGSR